MIEEIAAKIHSELWEPWAKTMIKTEKLSQDRLDRWNNDCFKPYNELSENMKEQDRIMARKLLPNLINNNSYLNDRKAIDRLKKEYLEHKNLVIGIDFDNTLFDYHKQGLEVLPVVNLIKKCSDLGFTICCHSDCANNENVVFKQQYLIHLDINATWFNTSPLNDPSKGESATTVRYKPFYSILLDDRAGLSASYNILLTTLKELKLYE